MKKNVEEYESPYCDVCGHCGYIGCCGIRNFIAEHIEGKTNCKNESLVIDELISLCDYRDEVFEENKKLKDNWNKLKEIAKSQSSLKKKYHNSGLWFEVDELLETMQELEGDVLK